MAQSSINQNCTLIQNARNYTRFVHSNQIPSLIFISQFCFFNLQYLLKNSSSASSGASTKNSLAHRPLNVSTDAMSLDALLDSISCGSFSSPPSPANYLSKYPRKHFNFIPLQYYYHRCGSQGTCLVEVEALCINGDRINACSFVVHFHEREEKLRKIIKKN